MNADASGAGDADAAETDAGHPGADVGSTSTPDESIDWDLARRVAISTARSEPYAASSWRHHIAEDFEEYTQLAEGLVADCTGLRSLSGPARGRVTDRAGWIDANLASFRRLLRPLTDTLASGRDAPLAPITRRVAGLQLGAMLGWMSTRVLGQYDLLIIEDDNPEDQDIVYYVAPNVVSLENRYAFDPRQFRLWLALHEVTHRAQFTGVEWMRAHFIGLVNTMLESVEPDPKRVMLALRRVIQARRQGDDPLSTGGLMALFASEAQVETLDRLAGLMSLLEGHGDVIMARASIGRVSSAERFARVMHRRRGSVRGFAKVIQRVIGLDAKLKQYIEGEGFIEAVEAEGGTSLLDRVWESPDYLPSIAEIRNPNHWVTRMGLSEMAA